MTRLDLDLRPQTAEAAGRGIERITTAGDRGATQVTAEEATAMARAITALLIQIGRLEAEIRNIKGDSE